MLVALLSCAAFFGLGDLASRAWILHWGNPLDLTRQILMVDPKLGWQQRAGLDTRFYGQSLHTNDWGWRSPSPSSSFLAPAPQKVLVLGPSSTFGWGVADDQTYPSQLQAQLQAALRVESGGASPVVINAGEIGYSSDQGVRLFQGHRLESLKASWVVVAYGVNDLDENRFYFQSDRTDADEFSIPKAELPVRILNRVFSTSLGVVAFKFSSWIRGAALGSSHLQGSGRIRVRPDQFERNLDRLAGLAADSGSKVILLTTVTQLSPQDRISQGVRAYNEIAARVARSHGALLGDLEKWLGSGDRAPLFVDPIHFSAEGNRRIAQGLFDLIREKR